MTAALDFYGLALGDEFTLDVRFDAADVAAYLDATGEPAERWDGVAPPLGVGAYVLAALLERMPLPNGTLHTGQEFEFLRAVTPGEALEARLRVAQRGERRGALLVALEYELFDESDEVVLRGRSTVAAPAPTAEDA